VKRHGGCGLVVTEMVSAEGLVRGIDRTLEYANIPRRSADFDSDLRRRSRQDGCRRADRRRDGADIVDVNMGCPVRRSQAQRRLQPDARTQSTRAVIAAMTKGSQDPRDGEDARRMERRRAQRADAGADGSGRWGLCDRGPRPYGGAKLQRIGGLGLVSRIAASLTIPVFGSGDCPRAGAGDRSHSIGRGRCSRRPWRLAQPWILAQAMDLAPGARPAP